MQLRYVKEVASKAGVGLNGIKLSIVRDESLIGRGLNGYAFKNNIFLYPDAFQNYESLVRTLAHERTHIFQFKLYGMPTNSDTGKLFEKAAYGIEDTFLKYYKLH